MDRLAGADPEQASHLDGPQHRAQVTVPDPTGSHQERCPSAKVLGGGTSGVLADAESFQGVSEGLAGLGYKGMEHRFQYRRLSSCQGAGQLA